MKVPVSVILISSVFDVLASSIRIAPLPKDLAQRRQFIAYGNNIAHENPSYPDQTAESSVNVNFSPQDGEARNQIFRGNQYQQEYSQSYTQNYPTSSPESQLFNVGYSVSFTDGNKPALVKTVPKYSRNRNLDEGEIITGTRKHNEEVQVPAINMSPQEFVSSALLNTKKQNPSEIKSKGPLVSYSNPKVLLTQANLSPSTQKYYKGSEQLKPHAQKTQELQKKYSWRNLSPSVDIIRSTEIPITQKYQRSEPIFDHSRAFGRSQEFDYTNGIDKNNLPQQNTLFYMRHPSHTEKTQNIPVGLAQNIEKLPIDTTLLRDPISIQVDTRFAEDQLGHQMSYNPKYLQKQPSPDANYLQQNYRTIPVAEGSLINPISVLYKQEQPQGFQDSQFESNRYQFKIYGKPQPVPTSFKDGLEQKIKRNPRFLTDLHISLRPPPFDSPYQRRFRIF